MSEAVNKTQLDIEKAEDRGIIHRDYAAHYFRWTFAMKFIRYQDRVLDVGCANGMLCQVLYVNKYKPSIYVGLDIRPNVLDQIHERNVNFPVKTHQIDVRKERIPYKDGVFDKIVSFEMIEHFMPEYLPHTFEEIKRVLKPEGLFLLSTPNFNGQAAANHVHEYTEEELKKYVLKYFVIYGQYGTFASQSDIYPVLNEQERHVFDRLHDYYDSNVMSNIFAPLHPLQSRNILWVLGKHENE